MMFKSEKKCHGEGCSSHYIQNKKRHLCSECVFKLNHSGRSRQGVMIEKMKSSNNKKALSEEERLFEQNKVNQDNVKEVDQDEEDLFFLKEALIAGPIVGYTTTIKVQKKRKSMKKKTKKQTEIDSLYKATCIDMDYTTEPVCTGCLRYQGGDVKLSHSHIISREDCKRIGRPELISDRDNLTYHCLDFGENQGCHGLWENPQHRAILLDYNRNIAYVKRVAPELLSKYQYK